VLIGDPADAVVFDFKPGIDAGAQMLGRRGEDQRFTESRTAAQRRRAIDEAMADRAEGETRADVARRYDEAHGLTHIDFGDDEESGEHPEPDPHGDGA
jgi:GTP-binding protein